MHPTAEMKAASPFELDVHQCRRMMRSCSSDEALELPAPCPCPGLARLHLSSHGPHSTRLTATYGSGPDMNHISLYLLASESFETLKRAKNASAEGEPQASLVLLPLPSSSRYHAETSPGLLGTTLLTSMVPFSHLG